MFLVALIYFDYYMGWGVIAIQQIEVRSSILDQCAMQGVKTNYAANKKRM